MPFIMPSKVPPPPLDQPTGWDEITNAPGANASQGYTGAHTFMPYNRKILDERDSMYQFDVETLTYDGPLAANDTGDFWYGGWTTLSDGTVLATRRNSSKTYDPSSGSPLVWTDTANSEDISNPIIAAPTSGDAYRFGGTIAGAASLPTQTASKYNIATRTWSVLTEPLPVKMTDHDVAPLSDGRILVGGGWFAFNFGDKTYDYWFYDPSNDTYTPTTSIPTALWRSRRSGFVQLQNGLVYGMAGRNQITSGETNTTVVFDVENETWSLGTVTTPQFTSIKTTMASILPDGRIVLHASFKSYVSVNL